MRWPEPSASGSFTRKRSGVESHGDLEVVERAIAIVGRPLNRKGTVAAAEMGDAEQPHAVRR